MVAQRELVSGVSGSTIGLATRVLFLPVVGTMNEELPAGPTKMSTGGDTSEGLGQVARGLTLLGVCYATTPAGARGVTMRHGLRSSHTTTVEYRSTTYI